MATQTGKIVELKDGRRRRFRSREERRQIVEEALKAGASVSQVARAHDTFLGNRPTRSGKHHIDRPQF
jgi:hypothetical protein